MIFLPKNRTTLNYGIQFFVLIREKRVITYSVNDLYETSKGEIIPPLDELFCLIDDKNTPVFPDAIISPDPERGIVCQDL